MQQASRYYYDNTFSYEYKKIYLWKTNRVPVGNSNFHRISMLPEPLDEIQCCNRIGCIKII